MTNHLGQTGDSFEALAQNIRDLIAALEALPSLNEPEARLLVNMRWTLREWEAGDA